MLYHVIESQIRYCTPDEGGRKTGVYSGYRGQFHYDGDDFDGFQYFPDDPKSMIALGHEVRAFVRFLEDRWEQIHKINVQVGKTFQICEGARIVGVGVVTRLDVPESEWANLID